MYGVSVDLSFLSMPESCLNDSMAFSENPYKIRIMSDLCLSQKLIHKDPFFSTGAEQFENLV